MADSRLSFTVDGAVATLTFANPAQLNALAPEMVSDMMGYLDRIDDAKSGIRCLLLTGEGRAFSAGVDLAHECMSFEGKANPDAGIVLDRDFHPVLLRLRDLRVPFITAVNGAAAGVGMSFALMGDLVVAARSAYFLQAFRRVGLVPDGGSTWMLPRLVGTARARELSLLGERLPAETALAWGLVNRVVDDKDLMAEAMKLARNLAEGPTVALALTRRLYWESGANSLEEQLQLERKLQAQCSRTLDAQRAIRAFLDKKPAVFTGQ